MDKFHNVLSTANLTIGKKSLRAFTLIEVLVAMLIIAIAVTAILQANARTIHHTQHLQDVVIAHWVAEYNTRAMQLGLVSIKPGQHIASTTNMLGKNWYWQASTINDPKTPLLMQLTIQVSDTSNSRALASDDVTLIRSQ